MNRIKIIPERMQESRFTSFLSGTKRLSYGYRNHRSYDSEKITYLYYGVGRGEIRPSVMPAVSPFPTSHLSIYQVHGIHQF